MLKKILFADDLSKRALRVLEVALDLARRYGAELTILNVREDFLSKAEMVMLRVDLSDFQDDMKKKALAVKEEVSDDVVALKGQDVNYQLLLREGKPAEVIIDVARELEADLIVVGTHGASSLQYALFGSTSQGVIRHAGRSVLAVWTGD